jgi:hypothetical protein
MSNDELCQPCIAAQVCDIVHTLSPSRVQNHETLDERGFVVAPLAFLDGHVLLHASRQPQGTERLHHQRDPAQGGQGFFQRLGIHF